MQHDGRGRRQHAGRGHHGSGYTGVSGPRMRGDRGPQTERLFERPFYVARDGVQPT
jgi:hypothetical protein